MPTVPRRFRSSGDGEDQTGIDADTRAVGVARSFQTAEGDSRGDLLITASPFEHNYRALFREEALDRRVDVLVAFAHHLVGKIARRCIDQSIEGEGMSAASPLLQT